MGHGLFPSLPEAPDGLFGGHPPETGLDPATRLGDESAVSDRPERLGPASRITTTRQYETVKAGARALRGAHCMILALSCPAEATRFGFVASRRGVGGAVQRNRARRRLREIVRRRWPRITERGWWIVVIAHRTSVTAPHQELASDLERLLAQIGALAPIADGDA